MGEVLRARWAKCQRPPSHSGLASPPVSQLGQPATGRLGPRMSPLLPSPTKHITLYQLS